MEKDHLNVFVRGRGEGGAAGQEDTPEMYLHGGFFSILHCRPISASK